MDRTGSVPFNLSTRSLGSARLPSLLLLMQRAESEALEGWREWEGEGSPLSDRCLLRSGRDLLPPAPTAQSQFISFKKHAPVKTLMGLLIYVCMSLTDHHSCISPSQKEQHCWLRPCHWEAHSCSMTGKNSCHCFCSQGSLIN